MDCQLELVKRLLVSRGDQYSNGDGKVEGAPILSDIAGLFVIILDAGNLKTH